jgi:hypothetical protein
MVDFVIDGGVQTPTTTELLWPGGRGSFIVNGTGFTSAELKATFNVAAGEQSIDAALLVNATGVVNFELPSGTILGVELVAGGGSFAYVSARHITEVGAT